MSTLMGRRMGEWTSKQITEQIDGFLLILKGNQDAPLAKEHEEHRTKTSVSKQDKVQEHIFTSPAETLTFSTSGMGGFWV